MKRFSSIFLALLVVVFSSVAVFAAEGEDTERPEVVQNVTATAMDSAVKLSWDAAVDNVAVTGYVVEYGETQVVEHGDTYDMSIDVENVTEYTVEGLENDKTYYFGIYAYDEAENESSNWSKEVSATPSAEGADAEEASDDNDAPTVQSAEAVNNNTVKLVFNEAVVLPESDPENAFTIEDDDNLEALVVEGAEMDAEDSTNKTVLLTTAEQVENAAYTLTVGIDIKDTAGNNINSGTSDTAGFTGSGVTPEPVDEDGPAITKIERVDHKTIAVSFDEGIVVGIDPAANFVIHAEGDEADELEVLVVTLGPNSDQIDNATAVVETSPQETKTYVVKVMGITDEASNVISDTSNTVTFAGEAEEVEEEEEEEEVEEEEEEVEEEEVEEEVAGEEEEEEMEEEEETVDVIEPKDVASILAKVVMNAQKYDVTLTWAVPEENVGVTADQVIYKSEGDEESFEEEAVVDADVESYEVTGLEPGSYWFKITQRDSDGNETEGVIKKVILSETGPEMLGLLALSLGLGRFAKRKK